jgi:hypothetical protein
MMIENSPINVEYIMLFCACVYLTHILALDGFFFSHILFFLHVVDSPFFGAPWLEAHVIFKGFNLEYIWHHFVSIYLFGSKMEMNFATLILLEVKMIQSLVNLLYKYTLVQVVMFIQV